MDYVIHPLQGANAVEFGMAPHQVRELVGLNFTLFKRGARVENDDGTHPSDYYADDGIFFYYSPAGHLEAIEFAPSAAPVLSGVKFFEMPMKEAVEAFRQIAPDMKLKGDTAWSDALGFVLWTSDGWYDVEKQAWIDEDDEDWEPEEPKVGSILIAQAGSLGYLSD